MSLVLDVTAGNQMFYQKGKRGKSVIHMDRERTLAVKPTLFADFRHLPFRKGLFVTAIFDPPYHHRNTGVEGWRFWNPDLSKHSPSGRKPGDMRTWGHYGAYRSRRELIINLVGAAREFTYLGVKYVAFKWGEGDLTLNNALSCFKGYRIIFKRLGRNRGYYKKTGVYWITMRPPQ